MKQIALPIALDEAPTLSRFLAGPNEAALAHLQLWSGSPTRSPVPTYLWGETGSGKTHLLRSVAEALREHGAACGWIDAQTLEPGDFDEHWALVLFDDVHLYTAEQQHAAFSWFVQAQALQRGVLAAGAPSPADLQVREDLRTRLGWGHVFRLQVLGELERRSVLRREADARGIFLGDEVMDFMLRRFSRDLASLMALLERLDSYALREQRAITIPLLKAMLAEE